MLKRGKTQQKGTQVLYVSGDLMASIICSRNLEEEVDSMCEETEDFSRETEPVQKKKKEPKKNAEMRIWIIE
jgi:hypothetical protein